MILELVLWLAHQASSETITIGCLLAICSENHWSYPIRQNMDLAASRVNARGGVQLNLVYNCTPQGAAVVGRLALYQVQELGAVAIFGPMFSSQAEPVAHVAAALDVPVLSMSASAFSLSDKSSYPTFQRTIPPDSGQATVLLALCKRMGWHNLLIVYRPDAFGRSFSDTVQQAAQPLLGTASRVVVHGLEFNEDVATEADFGAMAARIKALDVRIIFFMCWETLGLLLAMEKLGMTRSEWVGILNADFSASLTEEDWTGSLNEAGRMDYVRHAAGWLKLHVARGGTALEGELTTSIGGKVVARYAYDIVTLFASAWEKQTNGSEPRLTELLRRERVTDGASGSYGFDGNGDPLREYEVLSVPVEGTDGIEYRSVLRVAAVDVATIASQGLPAMEHGPDYAAWVFPDGSQNAPADTPVVHLVGVSPHIQRASMACIGISFVLVLVLQALLHVHREEKVVKASSILFSHLILLGCYTGLTGVALSTLADRGMAWPCVTSPLFVAAGFSLTMGALLAKTWRLHQIFTGGEKLKRIDITNQQLLLPVVALASYDALVVLVWRFADAPAIVVRDDLLRQYTVVQVCSSLHPDVWLLLLTAPKALMLLYGLRLAYNVRRVDKLFRETQSIVSSMALLFVLCVITVPVLILTAGQIDATQFLLATTVSVALCGVALLLFVPKFLTIYGFAQGAAATSASDTQRSKTPRCAQHGPPESEGVQGGSSTAISPSSIGSLRSFGGEGPAGRKSLTAQRNTASKDSDDRASDADDVHEGAVIELVQSDEPADNDEHVYAAHGRSLSAYINASDTSKERAAPALERSKDCDEDETGPPFV